MGEQALLDRRRRLCRVVRLDLAAAVALGCLVGVVELAPGGGGEARPRVGAVLTVGLDGRGGAREPGVGVALGHRVVLRDLAEVGVGVAIAVHVLKHDVAAELLGAADRLDDAVVDRHDRRALLREDVDAAAVLARLDHVGGVLTALHALEELLLGQVVRVGRACVDGEAAFGEAGERADQVGRHAGDQPGPQQHGVDVPVGVVVRPDRRPDVVLVVRRLQIARRGEDRVDRVVRVLAAVLVGVDAVGRPGRRHELHPAKRARRRHVQVAAVVGLDLVDRRQDLPTDPVLDPGRLIDRQTGTAAPGTS